MTTVSMAEPVLELVTTLLILSHTLHVLIRFLMKLQIYFSLWPTALLTPPPAGDRPRPRGPHPGGLPVPRRQHARYQQRLAEARLQGPLRRSAHTAELPGHGAGQVPTYLSSPSPHTGGRWGSVFAWLGKSSASQPSTSSEVQSWLLAQTSRQTASWTPSWGPRATLRTTRPVRARWGRTPWPWWIARPGSGGSQGSGSSTPVLCLALSGSNLLQSEQWRISLQLRTLVKKCLDCCF